MMNSNIVICLCVLIGITSAQPTGGWIGAGATNPWIPPWLAAAPWYPKWSACTTIGAVCLDCNTRFICTKIGGLERGCNDPTLPYCNLGECSATPTGECAPVSSVPA